MAGITAIGRIRTAKGLRQAHKVGFIQFVTNDERRFKYEDSARKRYVCKATVDGIAADGDNEIELPWYEKPKKAKVGECACVDLPRLGAPRERTHKGRQVRLYAASGVTEYALYFCLYDGKEYLELDGLGWRVNWAFEFDGNGTVRTAPAARIDSRKPARLDDYLDGEVRRMGPSLLKEKWV